MLAMLNRAKDDIDIVLQLDSAMFLGQKKHTGFKAMDYFFLDMNTQVLQAHHNADEEK